ncbi:hypothetical protein RCH09_001607 [Actimicrobium sp. GrIS 1.19]|nr:hypothetical protein [Actimicrobium sp. GrIS 1.19]
MPCAASAWRAGWAIVSLSTHAMLLGVGQDRPADSAATGAAPIRVRLIAAAPSSAPPRATRPGVNGNAAVTAGSSLQAASAAPQSPLFFAPAMVDKIALPISEPDAGMLAHLRASGLPLRLRIFIDAGGAVVAVEALSVHPDDAQAFDGIAQMLRDTGFTPAMWRGRAVGSFRDVEFQLREQ